MNEPSDTFSAYESVPDALLVVGRGGLIVYANKHAEQLFGYAPDQLVGVEVEALVPEKFRSQHVLSRAEFNANPSVRPMGYGRELLGLRNDGREFPVEIGIGPADQEGYMLAVVRDISQVLSTREDLGEIQAQLRSLIDSLGSHVALLNSRGEIIAINEPWARFAQENGAGPNSGLGMGVDYLEVCRCAAEDEPAAQTVLSGIRAVLDGSQHLFSMEYPCHSPSQHRWFSMTVTPVRAKRGGAVVVHSDVTEKVQARQELERKTIELAKSSEELRTETEYLRAEINRTWKSGEIIGNSDAIVGTLEKVDLAAKTDVAVLVLGETGTGKELLARAIHSRSNRQSMPLVRIDCATLPPGLIESELFGHEKGAFTGAHEKQIGRFERAHGGTVFLDEIGELSPNLQAKLLRVLQEGEFHRIGSKREQKVDVRIIAATNRDLEEEVRQGHFRSDLYYRLCVFPIESPPLRKRRTDIPLLALFFLSNFQSIVGKRIDVIARSSMDALVAYDWPGNIRELKNVIERSAILCSGDILIVQEALGDHGSPDLKSDSSLPQNLEDIERANILRALEESGWKVKGEGNAASRLGINPSTLRSRIKKLGISRR
jgi:PAS domain S-box-containing protein